MTVIAQMRSIAEEAKAKARLKIGTTHGVLFLFLLIIFIISFIVPMLSYGRIFGTDEYTHLFHSSLMYSSNSMAEFYQTVSSMVSNPDDPSALFNYPFATWLFGGTIAKIIGFEPHAASFLFAIIFVVIMLVSFYYYSGIFLETTNQKVLSLLFLLSMPQMVMNITGFRPMVFVMPFVFLLLYCVMKETVEWKSIGLILLSTFMVTIIHTGTFIFLLALSIAFLFLYSLIWGKFSRIMYIFSVSMLFIYILAISLFPYMHPQYVDKATMFLKPGDFLASNLHIFFADDLSQI
ncbi:hypothetical protein, partial [Methanocalculus sp.]|uniref:hypothetical protein n=1 Tax=Methanocalculus sp. TaxID=2004547 RepID=UPI002604DDEC